MISHAENKKQPTMNPEVKDVLSLRTAKDQGTITKAEVESFASQHFVQNAMSKPSKVSSVLSFFFVSTVI